MIDWDEIENGAPRVVSAPLKDPQRNVGWQTVVLLLGASSVVYLAGSIWALTSSFFRGSFFHWIHWQQDLVLSFGYAFGLLVTAGIFWLLGRWRKQLLWRGIGLTFGLMAIFVILSGLFLALVHYFDRFNIPHWPVVLFRVVLVSVFWRVWRPWRISQFDEVGPPPAQVTHSIGFSLLLGSLIAGIFVYGGSLGTVGEAIIALLDAFSLACLATAVLILPFHYAPSFPQEWPRLAVFSSGLLLIGLTPALVAGRGLPVQGVMIGGLLAAFAFLGASLLIFNPSTDVRSKWLDIGVYFFAALFIPLLLTDGVELDFLVNVSRDWLMQPLFSALAALILFALFFYFRTFFARVWRWNAAGTFVGLAAVLLLGVFYFYSGGSGFHADGFVLVLHEQADTRFAEEIEDRDERVTAVYDTLTRHADESQRVMRAILEANDVVYRPFYLVNALEVYTYNPLVLWQISRYPDVKEVARNPKTRPVRQFFTLVGDEETALEPSPVPAELIWGMGQIKADRVWDELNIYGEGIVVGGADSGVAWEHPALQPSYRGATGEHDYHWYDPQDGYLAPLDLFGHGTNTLGLAIGADGIGVAPDAKWIACRNLPTGLATPATHLGCMEFLFAPFPLDGDPLTDGNPILGAHVTNSTWSCSLVEGCDGDMLASAFPHLRHAGQMMVVIAGNWGTDCSTVTPLGRYDEVFTVGATNREGAVAGLSSRGPVYDGDGRLLSKPDLVAPGVDVTTVAVDGGYVTLSGTSLSAPYVTGVVALMWSANPDLIGNIEMTEQILRDTAVPPTDETGNLCSGEPSDEGHSQDYGAGIVNALGAVEAALDYDK